MVWNLIFAQKIPIRSNGYEGRSNARKEKSSPFERLPYEFERLGQFLPCMATVQSNSCRRSIGTARHFFTSAAFERVEALGVEIWLRLSNGTCVSWEEIFNGVSFIPFRSSSGKLHISQDTTSATFLYNTCPHTGSLLWLQVHSFSLKYLQ